MRVIVVRNQQRLWHDDAYPSLHFVVSLLWSIELLWMEKHCGRGWLLEYLESWGTKIIMRKLIVRQLCVGRYKETKILI